MARQDTPEDIKRKCAERKKEREAELKKQGRAMTKTGNPRGRPKGGSLAVKHLNELAEQGKVAEMLDKAVQVASDPEHKNYAQALKLVMDRVANISHFEKGSSTGTPQVNINIGTVASVDVEPVSEQ